MSEHSVEPETAWVGVEDLPVEFANTFVALVGENAIVLNLGTMVPPIIESEEQLAALQFVPIRPIARVAMTPANLDGLIETLEDARKDHAEFTRERDKEKP